MELVLKHLDDFIIIRQFLIQLNEPDFSTYHTASNAQVNRIHLLINLLVSI